MTLIINPQSHSSDGKHIVGANGDIYINNGGVKITKDAHFGKVLSFNGKNTLEVPVENLTSGKTISISYWINVEKSENQYAAVFAIHQNKTNKNDDSGFGVFYGEGNFIFVSGSDRSMDEVAKPIDSAELEPGRWVHWRITKDTNSGITKVWRNGVIWHKQTDTHNLLGDVDKVIIGGGPDGDSSEGAFKGKIAQLRISADTAPQDDIVPLFSLSPESISEELKSVVDTDGSEVKYGGVPPKLSFDKFFGACLLFDANNNQKSYLNLPTLAFSDDIELTISFWAKPNSNTDACGILQAMTSKTNIGLEIRLPWRGISGEPEIGFEVEGKGIAGDEKSAKLGPDDLVLNKWTHWAFVRSIMQNIEPSTKTKKAQNSYQIYRNGIAWHDPVLVDEATPVDPTKTLPKVISATLGSDANGEHPFNGTIAQFNSYNTALDGSKIIEQNPALANINKVVAEDGKIAAKLIDLKIFSCLQIVNMGEAEFKKLASSAFGKDTTGVTKAYLRAKDIKSQLTIHYMGLNAEAGHYKYILPNNQSGHSKVEHLPSYHDLFHSTEYCDVDENHSIYSPSAYLVDLQRFIDQNISTDSEASHKVAIGHHLDERRPDLKDIELKPKNATTIIPKLEIVDKVFETQLEVNQEELAAIKLSLNGDINNDGKSKTKVTLKGNEHFEAFSPKGEKKAFDFDGKTTLTTPLLKLGKNYSFCTRLRLGSMQSGALFEIGKDLIYLSVLPSSAKSKNKLKDVVLGDSRKIGKTVLDNAYMSYPMLVTPDKWIHICLVCKAGNCKLYIDGVARHERAFTIDSVQSNFIKIGQDLTGQLADVGIYQFALNDAQISDIASSAGESTTALYQNISEKIYPPSLPFHLPLEEIRSNLHLMNSSLDDIWTTFNQDRFAMNANKAREILNMSPCEWNWLTGKAKITENGKKAFWLEFIKQTYGLDKNSQDFVALGDIAEFAKHTQLSAKEIKSLIYGDLSESEIIAGIQTRFYINGGVKTPGFIQLDQVKGILRFNVDDKRQPLTSSQFARLFNVVRLSKCTGWSYSDVDWALQCALSSSTQSGKDENAKNNIESALVILAFIKQWTVEHAISAEESCLLVCKKMRNFGRLSGKSFFEQRFGNIQIMSKLNLLKWNGHSQSQDDHLTSKTNAWLMSGLRISANDVIALGYHLWETKYNFTTPEELVATLYRIVTLGRISNLTVPDTLSLLNLSGQTADITEQSSEITAKAICKFTDQAAEFANISVKILQIDYFVNGRGPTTSKIGLSDRDIVNFSKSAREAIIKVLHKPVSGKTSLETTRTQTFVKASGIVITPVPDVVEIWAKGKGKNKKLKLRKIDDLKPTAQLQRKTLESHLSNLLGVTPDILEEVWFWHKPNLNVSDVLDYLMRKTKSLEKLTNDDDASDDAILSWVAQSGLREKFLEPLNRCCVIIKALGLAKSEIKTFLANADCLEEGHKFTTSFDTFTHLANYKYFENSYHDTKHVLLDYLIFDDTDKDINICDLAGWNIEDLQVLRQTFKLGVLSKATLELYGRYPDRLTEKQRNNGALRALNISELVFAKNCFDLSNKLKLSINEILKIAQFGVETSSDYLDYQRASDTLLAALNAKYSDTDWEKVHKPIQLKLLENKRDALLPYVMITLQSRGIEVHTPKDLYEYLLIDVEVSGAFTTSVIKEALGCLQLYIYRCRMQMEPGVVLSPNLEKYWQWIKNYRVWEANRKVFLYPENYTQPELRKEKSQLFDKLLQDLQQGHLDEETVDKAVKNYLDDFAIIGNLKIAGSCVSHQDDPIHPKNPVTTLHLVGRTSSEPYKYFSRSVVFKYQSREKRYDVDQWRPWEEIKLSIHSRLVTPVFAFGRLFIFWADIKPAKSAVEGKAGKDIATVAAQSRSKKKQFHAQIRYSFNQFSKSWVAPQPLGDAVNLSTDTKTVEQTYTPETQRVSAIAENGGIVAAYPAQKPDGTYPWEPSNGKLSVQLNENLVPQNDFHWPLSKETLIVGNKKTPVKSPKFGGGDITAQVSVHGGHWNTDSMTVRQSGADNYIYIQFDCKKAVTLNHIQFNHEDNHNDGQAGLDTYQIVLTQTYTNTKTDTSLTLGKYTVGPKNRAGTIKFDNKVSLPKGKSEIRWIATKDKKPNFTTKNDYISISKLTLGFAKSTILYAAQNGLINNPAELKHLPSNTKTYPVYGQPNWAIIDSGKSEYLALPSSPSGAKTNFRRYIRLNTSTIHFLSQLLFAEGIKGLLSDDAQQSPEDDFKLLGPDPKLVDPSMPKPILDLNGSNGLYFRELFFHMPFLVANNLTTAQQFELAQKWYHYIFDPTHTIGGNADHQNDRYWRYRGLRSGSNLTLNTELNNNPVKELEVELGNQQQISRYYDDPFDAHAIAALRPIAYQKTIVMHYIDNLIKWGDKLYRQDTRETLVEAELLYILAYDLLGKKPKDVGACALPATQTLSKLLAPYDTNEIPEFLIGLEQSLVIDPRMEAPDNPNNEIPGSYFGIPENDKFTAHWDTVEARLYNLRHYLTIDGKAQHLALFQPPIDPMQLVAAMASGVGLASAVAGLSAPLPHYRFFDLVEKAKQAVQTTIQFGGALKAALERKDAEQLSLLRSTHEQSLLQFDIAAKTEQLNVASSNLKNLQNRLAAGEKAKAHYTGLITKGLLAKEKLQFTQETNSISDNSAAQDIKAVATAAYLIPTVFGFSDGDLDPGEAANQAAMIAEGQGGILSQRGQLTAISAQNDRRLEEWQFQLETANTNVDQITEQIKSATLQVQIAQAQIDHQNKAISQAKEVELFLKSKFSTQELYQWLVGRLSGLYFQMYQLAFSASSAAQSAWQYERAEPKMVFIHPGAWDNLHKGLLAGESLMLDLHRMEQAYTKQDKRRLEIVKTISLKELYDKAPKASQDKGKSKFEAAKNDPKGIFAFSLKEQDFDIDYPLHKSKTRQIKSINISLPALLGPYQNIHAMLTQLSSATMIDGEPAASPRAGEQVALSHGVNDTGMFDLNYNDKRYLPFECTGVKSDWELAIPNDKGQNPGVLTDLTDIIIELRYTVLQ